jgi:hypothetical protein
MALSTSQWRNGIIVMASIEETNRSNISNMAVINGENNVKAMAGVMKSTK